MLRFLCTRDRNVARTVPYHGDHPKQSALSPGHLHVVSRVLYRVGLRGHIELFCHLYLHRQPILWFRLHFRGVGGTGLGGRGLIGSHGHLFAKSASCATNQ
jgi:hypothetical protein